MELRTLRSFLTVANEGNFTKAADIIHITQPALSRQLMELESELGAKLFIRGKRRVTLTEEGNLLYQRAKELLELAQKTQQELTDFNGLIGGEISIGCGELAASAVLPALFRTFSLEFPLVQYSIFTGNADHILERMDKGLLDIGLLLEPVDIDKFNFIRLSVKERWGVLLPIGNPLAQKKSITAEDLLQFSVILPQRTKVQNELASWFGTLFDTLHVVAYSNLTGNASVLVESGLGCALVLEGSANRYSSEKFCCRPLYPELCATSVLAWKKKQVFSPLVRQFIAHIQTTFCQKTMQK